MEAPGSPVWEPGRAKTRVYAAREVHGSWQAATALPGLAALDTGQDAAVTSLSYPAAGTCTAGGSYLPASSGITQPFVAGESGGTWGQARTLAGLPAETSTADGGTVTSVSCAGPGQLRRRR